MQTDLLLKFCTICKKNNIPNALVCVGCGNSFEFPHFNGNNKTTENIVSEHITSYLGTPSDLKAPLAGVAFFLLGKTEVFALFNNHEIYIGRMEVGTTEPFVDLTRVDGFQMGVSRRHALIHWEKKRAEIMDLSSSNGTFLDGNRLSPNRFYELKSGSVIQVGRLKLVTIF